MRRLGTLVRALAMGGALCAAPLGACGDDDTKTTTDTTTATDTGTPDTSTGDTTAADTGTPDTGTPDTGSDTTAGPVTWDQVYPIFKADCTPCHAGTTAAGGAGGHAMAATDMAIAYEASQLDSGATAPAACKDKSKGECALIRIQDGSMPANGACSTDPKGATCPSAEEQALIQQWIDDGQLGPE